MTGHIRKRTTKKGVSWQIIIEKGLDSNGKRLRDYITVEGNKKDAERILNEKLVELEKGLYIEPSKLTVEGHIMNWIEIYVKPNLSPTTLKGYLVNLKNHTFPHIGTTPLQKLTPMQIQHMYGKLQEKGLSPRSIKYVHSTLRNALQFAYKMQLIPRNPADFVTLPKQIKYRGKAYEENEVIEMLEKAHGTEIEVPLQLAVGLGLRRGELLGLRWCDINLETNQITICQNLVFVDGEFIFRQPKSESGKRTIEMPSALNTILRRHKKLQLEDKLFFGSEYKDLDLVCCKRDGNPHNPGGFSHKFEKFLKKHGLRQIRLHDLRHTNASLMLQYNVPAKVASQRLGHSTVSITLDLYSHVLGNLQSEAADKIDSGIFKRLEGIS